MKAAASMQLAALLPAVLLAACNGVSWPSERIVTSLRVLGVQAQPASVTPGQSSQLSLLCADGIGGPNTDTTCNVEVAWFGACDNPPKNDPSKCLSQYAGWLDQITLVLDDHTLSSNADQFQVAQTFQYKAPQNVLQNEVTVGGETIHYGSSYVYFAACAGKLVPAAGLTDQLPVQCRDRSTGALLDQRRFVVGVTTIYAYDKILNHNPQTFTPAQNVIGLPPQYASATPYTGKACSVDSDCPRVSDFLPNGAVSAHSAVSACASDGVCAPLVQACNKNVPGSCNPYIGDIAVAVSSFLLTGLDGTPIVAPLKSLWIDCYANAGAWFDDPRHGIGAPPASSIANAAAMGLLDQFTTMTGCGGGWQAPSQPTDQARIWAVIRDDRGGLAWVEKRFVVR